MLVQRQGVLGRELAEQIVWVLLIDQRQPLISFAGLEDLRRAAGGQCAGLGGEHLVELKHACADFAVFHQHQPIRRLKAVESTRSTLEISGKEQVAVRHQHPGTDVLHPHRRRNGSGFKVCP